MMVVLVDVVAASVDLLNVDVDDVVVVTVVVVDAVDDVVYRCIWSMSMTPWPTQL